MQLKSTQNLPIMPMMEEDTIGASQIGRSRKILNAKKEEVQMANQAVMQNGDMEEL